MITRDNCEEYMMMHADGELRPDEERELIAFVNKHPELKKEMGLYGQTRMAPDTAQVFANKEALLKPVTTRRIIAFPQWKKYSIAAGIAALVFISLFEYVNTNKTNNVVANMDAITQPSKQVIPAPAINNLASKAQDVPVKKDKIILKSLPAKQRINTAIVNVKKRNAKSVIDNERGNPPILYNDEINSLPVASIKEIPARDNIAEVLETKDIPEYAIEKNNEKVKKTFWDKLPIDDIKKRQLENIAGAAANVYKDVSAARQDLYDKSISVDIKVEKRKLVISF